MSRDTDEKEFDEAFNMAIKHTDLTEKKKSLEDINTQDINEIDKQYRNRPQVLDELKPLDYYFNYIDDAIRYGFIGLDHLPAVLAKNESYGELLPKLWIKYQCALRGTKTPQIENLEDRINVWYTLLYRWAFGLVGGTPSGLNAMPYLPLHTFNEETGRYDEYHTQTSRGVAYVKLDDLKKYFTETIEIPLPTQLFPDHERKDDVPLKQSSPGLTIEAGTKIDPQVSAQEIDAIIEKFTIIPESDRGIKIQEPGRGKRPTTFDSEKLKFSKLDGILWKVFLEIINNEGFYSVGVSGKKGTVERGEYGKRQGHLKEFSKKLRKTFNDSFSIYFSSRIPDNYSFFVLYRDDGKKGIYKLKIPLKTHTKDDSRYGNNTEKELLNLLFQASNGQARSSQNYFMGKINTIKLKLIENHGMTKKEIEKKVTDYICSKTDKEEIEKDFSNSVYIKDEHHEDLEQN